MDTPGSDMSSDSSDSSADSPSAESTPAQIIQSAPTLENHNSVQANDTVVDQDDSDSDVSMSAETDDEDDEAPRNTIQLNTAGQIMEQPTTMIITDASAETSNKRKYEDSTEHTTNGHTANGAPLEVRKRPKPDDEVQSLKAPAGHLRQDKSLLPAEIWHNIFTFIPPRSLGLLLRVNNCFNAYLDPSSSNSSPDPLSRSAAKLLKADAIWRASRVLFRPGMPAPLRGKSELDMWKLACSSSCQFCGKKQQPNAPPPIDQWHPGPGENGIAPIWCFGVRTCGPCLQQRSSKVASGINSRAFLFTNLF
jgi:hypothetical protein